MEQVLVARLIHSFHSDNPAEQLQLLLTAQEELNKGGPRRMRHTLPALGFAGLALVRRLTRGGQTGPGATPEALLQWTLGVAMSLAEVCGLWIGLWAMDCVLDIWGVLNITGMRAVHRIVSSRGKRFIDRDVVYVSLI